MTSYIQRFFVFPEKIIIIVVGSNCSPILLMTNIVTYKKILIEKEKYTTIAKYYF
jgi:hypothetical protein